MGVKWGNFVIKNRWVIIFLMPLLIALLGYGTQFLTFKTDYRVFFSKGNPQMEDFEWMQDTYNKEDNILMVFAPKDKKVFTRKTLSEIEEITEEAWMLPNSTRVDSLSNYQHTEAIEDDLNVGNLYEDAANLTDQQLKKIRSIALNEPLLKRRLISPNSEVTAINITFEMPGISPSEVPEIASKVVELQKE